MAFTPLFYGAVNQGKVKLDDKDNFQLWVDSLDGEVELTITKRRHSRTRSQNGYYWAVIVDMLAEELGYSKDETHAILKQKFLSKTINFKGQEIKIARSTASLKTMEFETYTEAIRQWTASELNTKIPLPGEVIVKDDL